MHSLAGNAFNGLESAMLVIAIVGDPALNVLAYERAIVKQGSQCALPSKSKAGVQDSLSRRRLGATADDERLISSSSRNP